MHKDLSKIQPILEVSNLSKHYKYYGSIFDIKKNIIKAVDGVSFGVFQDEIFAIVGETGCGKSTLVKLIMGLIDKSGGDIRYKGEPLNYKDKKKGFRKRIQIVFQDPYASLNPKKKIYKIITYPAIKNGIIVRKERIDYAKSMLKDVGLDEKIVYNYPYQLSGGQRQRVGIARSLSVHPELLILDEPVSALDMSISAQILNLLTDLREKESMSYIFVTHDLKLVRHLADRVMVMYGGKILEISPSDSFFNKPAHPYSAVLYNSMFFLSRQQGEDNNKTNKIGKGIGCVYFDKCYASKPICRDEDPPFKEIEKNGARFVKCFFPFTPLNL